MYSEKEMRKIANHYAVGNRFDRPLPKMLLLSYLESSCSAFFKGLAAKYKDRGFEPVFSELVDYGYNLASLDNVERAKKQTLPDNIQDIQYPSLSRFTVLKNYSSDFFQALKSAGIKIYDPRPYGIAFFIHKTLGPTTLTLSKDLHKFLNLCDGTHTIEDIIHLMDPKSDLICHSKKYESAIQTISDIQSDLRSIGLLDKSLPASSI